MTASRRRLLPPSNTSREKSKLLGLIRNNLLKHMARLTFPDAPASQLLGNS
jgi:hypothetical protein